MTPQEIKSRIRETYLIQGGIVVVIFFMSVVTVWSIKTGDWFFSLMDSLIIVVLGYQFNAWYGMRDRWRNFLRRIE